jgi:hypothetical protein
MCGVGIGMQQRHRDAVRSQRGDAVEERRHAGLVQGCFGAAVRAHAFCDAKAAVARDQRRERLGCQAVDVPADVAVDLQHILEARGRQQYAVREFPLQHRVGCDGRTMQQQADIGQREAEAVSGLGHATQQADGGVLWRCRRLPGSGHAVPRIEDLEVGKGAADIDRDADGTGRIIACHADCSREAINPSRSAATAPSLGRS